MHPTSWSRVAFVRAAFVGCVLLACAIVDARSAMAHGGTFREGGGLAPAIPGTGSGAPTLPGGTPITPSGRTLPAARRIYAAPLVWRVWWQLRRDELLPAAGSSTRRAVVTGAPAAPRMGTLAEDELSAERIRLRRLSRHVVEPLLRSISQREDQSTEDLAAALIGWARCATQPPALEYFTRRVDGRYRMEVREAALIAMGLLRRSDPSAQFPAEYLDRARAMLRATLARTSSPRRVRAFAALALGLLGDQPTVVQRVSQSLRLAHMLWMVFLDANVDDSIRHCALIALGMQPPAAIPATIRDGLMQIAKGRKALRRTWTEQDRSHALTTLARIGHAPWRNVAKVLVRQRRADPIPQHTAIELLGRYAKRYETEERHDIASLLRHACKRASTPTNIKGAALVAIGEVLQAELLSDEPSTAQMKANGDILKRMLIHGRLSVRPFAALGMGLALREVTGDVLAVHEFAKAIRAKLSATRRIVRGSDEAVAAHALACGFARASDTAPWLIREMSDRNAGAILRAHAALALGLLGRADSSVRVALRSAAMTSDAAGLHVFAVRALTMLGQDQMPALLHAHLQTVRSTSAMPVLILGLARTMRVDALAPLLGIVGDPKQPAPVRTMTIAALGLLADAEPRPSRTLLIPSINRTLLSFELVRFLSVL